MEEILKQQPLAANRAVNGPPAVPRCPEAEASASEDPETIQERVQEVLEENSRLRSENEALRVGRRRARVH